MQSSELTMTIEEKLQKANELSARLEALKTGTEYVPMKAPKEFNTPPKK